MKAKVIKEFPGRPDREALTRTIEVGETIDGELAAVAVREQWAEEVEEIEALPEDEDNDDSQSDLGTLPVDALKALAVERSIDLGGATKKADIIAAIKAAVADAQ